MKDLESRIVLANSAYFSRIGVRSLSDLKSGSEEHFYPADLYKGYIKDDQRVFCTGRALENRLELYFDESGKLDWFCTTKLPLFGKNGKVIGLQGIMRRYLQQSEYDGFGTVKAIIKYVNMNLSQPMRLSDLSEACGLSIRQINRHIHDAIGETPHGLVVRTRVRAASEELAQTDDSILAIAIRCGFPDQSAFTKAFRLRMGQTPKEFRERFREN